MIEPSGCSIVLCTAPPDRARELADRLLDARLAACVNLLPGIESRYLWQGRREVAGETLLLIKTARARVTELTARLAEWHPYDVPEVLELPVATGLAAYLEWVAASVRGA